MAGDPAGVTVYVNSTGDPSRDPLVARLQKVPGVDPVG
jgi:hypothetical protein